MREDGKIDVQTAVQAIGLPRQIELGLDARAPIGRIVPAGICAHQMVRIDIDRRAIENLLSGMRGSAYSIHLHGVSDLGAISKREPLLGARQRVAVGAGDEREGEHGESQQGGGARRNRPSSRQDGHEEEHKRQGKHGGLREVAEAQHRAEGYAAS